MTLHAKVTHGLKWQAIMTGGRQVLSFLIVVVLARKLDQADLGLMQAAFNCLFFAGLVTDPGLITALVQREKLEREHWDSVFWFNVISATVLCVVTIIGADVISSWFNEPRLAPVLRWSAIGMILSAASFVHGGMFTREISFRTPAIRNLLGQAVGGVIGLAMAFTGWGVWALVGQQLGASLAGTVFLWSVSTYRPSLRISWVHLRDLFSISSTVFASNLLWYLISRLDQIIIARYAGAAALGLYAIGGKIPEQIKLATQQPLLDVLVPAMSRLQQDHHRMREAIRRGMELNSTVVFAIYVGLALVSQDVVVLLFGYKWAEAGILCSLLCLYALVGAVHIYNYPVLLALGVTGKFVGLTALQTIGVAVACLVGIQFGVSYLVLGLIINSLIMVIPSLGMVQRQIGVTIAAFYRPCLVPAVAAVAMTVAVLGAGLAFTSHISPWLRLGIHCALGAAVYLGVIQILSPSTLKFLFQTLKQVLPGGAADPNPLGAEKPGSML